MTSHFETARLSLRPVTRQDVDLLLELDRDPEVMRFLTGRPSTRREVQQVVRERQGSQWVAFKKVTGAFVGWFGLIRDEDDGCDIGYRLARRWWGQGLATEGMQALIAAAFADGAQRVTAQTMAVNRRSRSVMERCGMRYVRTYHLEWDDPLPGTEEGEVEYELTLDLWKRGRA